MAVEAADEKETCARGELTDSCSALPSKSMLVAVAAAIGAGASTVFAAAAAASISVALCSIPCALSTTCRMVGLFHGWISSISKTNCCSSGEAAK